MTIKHDSNLASVQRELFKQVDRSLLEAGVHVQNQLKKALQQPPVRTGVKYKALPQRSSAPGQSPAKQHGDLRRSVKFTSIHGPITDRQAEVGSKSPVGVWLETGTRNMAPRPWFRKTFVRSVQAVERLARRRFNWR